MIREKSTSFTDPVPFHAPEHEDGTQRPRVSNSLPPPPGKGRLPRHTVVDDPRVSNSLPPPSRQGAIATAYRCRRQPRRPG
jgi:hypothetical protein